MKRHSQVFWNRYTPLGYDNHRLTLTGVYFHPKIVMIDLLRWTTQPFKMQPIDEVVEVSSLPLGINYRPN
jgi:hypothetical protein